MYVVIGCGIIGVLIYAAWEDYCSMQEKISRQHEETKRLQLLNDAKTLELEERRLNLETAKLEQKRDIPLEDF